MIKLEQTRYFSLPDIELNWPLDLRPGSRVLHPRFHQALKPAYRASPGLERDAARWVTVILVRAELDSRRFDALLAALRGSVGHVFVPDFRRPSAKGSLAGSPQLVSGTGKAITD